MNEKIEVVLGDYANAKDGSILIKRNGTWQITNFEELNKSNESRLKEIDDLKLDLANVKNYSKHFVKYAVSHFLVIFAMFKVKIMEGDISVEDETLLKLDERVINKEISVEDALKLHPYLETTFKSVFSDNQIVEFPEV